MASLFTIAAIERLTLNLPHKPNLPARLVRCETVRELANENVPPELREKALQALTDYWLGIFYGKSRFRQQDLFAFTSSLIIFSLENDSSYFLEMAFLPAALCLTSRERKLIGHLLGGFAGNGTGAGISANNALIDLAELAHPTSDV